MDMCKFSGTEDVGYQRTTYVLASLFDDITRVEQLMIKKGVFTESNKQTIVNDRTTLDVNLPSVASAVDQNYLGSASTQI